MIQLNNLIDLSIYNGVIFVNLAKDIKDICSIPVILEYNLRSIQSEVVSYEDIYNAVR